MTFVFGNVANWFSNVGKDATVEESNNEQEIRQSDEKCDQENISTNENENKTNDNEQNQSLEKDLKEVSHLAMNAAKDLGGYIFNLGKTYSIQVAKTAKHLKETIEENTIIGDFTKEQEKFLNVNREKKKMADAAVPPWVGYNEEELMKTQIMDLSKDKRNVLRNPPSGIQFHFDFENSFPIALVMLEEDERLKALRFELVPKQFVFLFILPYLFKTKVLNWHKYFSLIHYLGPKLSHSVFNNLYELKSLNIDGDLADGFGESFSTLKSLQKLIISSRLSTLANSTFINFQNISLKNLTLAGAAVREIESEAFRPLKALTYLDLSYNSGLRFANLSHSLNGLSDGLQILMLTNIYGRYNPDTCLDEEFFKELSMKKNLTILKLNKNDLLEITNKMSIYIRSLEYLDISHNQLQYIGGWPLFVVLLVNLKFANFGEQVRKGLDRTHVGNVPVITYSENTCNAKDIKDVPPCKFSKTKGLKEPWCGLCPRNLTVLDLSRSRNDDVSVFPPSLIFGNCQISNYSYRNNEVKKAIGPIVVFRPVSLVPVTFDFGDNGMHCLSPEFLKISILRGLRVGRLILDGNDLSYQLEQDQLGETFAVYSNLTELNLANNKLRVLHNSTFYNLTKLEILNLSSNLLESLDFDISRLKELKVLDLRDNRFATFVPDDMSAISSLSQGKDYGWLTLYIERNAFTCSCDNIHFINWIIENKTKIDNFHNLTCKNKNIFIRLADLQDMAYDMKLSCYYVLPMIISGAILALLIICIMIGIIAYKYRWDIRYYLIAHSQKKRQYLLLQDQENDYLYDAFVSYDMNDRSWIVQELISNIEQTPPLVPTKPSTMQCNTSREIANEKDLLKNVKIVNYDSLVDGPASLNASFESICNEDAPPCGEYGDGVTFRLCIHERDFELGNGIEENILNAIQSSRMVILIVSSHFIKSKWCRLEVELAKMECLERGRNIVVTVLLEPIQERLKGLEWFMKRYTYLEWFTCDTMRKKDEFWKRLKLALRGKHTRKIDCQC